jgi:hypothetical protein
VSLPALVMVQILISRKGFVTILKSAQPTLKERESLM